ncbi:unnamed protein product [Ceratitis capitata]|uniref:(Mediterranean fruit fly) hypothetical protein n=1 Tax=Ceratitis capitata TaxID=7213 RepID=A0A811U3E7_CERCA|nr:unnamed protein product [Ceratitis capitata]
MKQLKRNASNSTSQLLCEQTALLLAAFDCPIIKVLTIIYLYLCQKSSRAEGQGQTLRSRHPLTPQLVGPFVVARFYNSIHPCDPCQQLTLKLLFDI